MKTMCPPGYHHNAFDATHALGYMMYDSLCVVDPICIYRNTIKYTKRWKQSSAIKQHLETLFLAIKLCTDFPTDVIWINTMCAVSLANHLRAVADAFRLLRTHQRY